MQKTWFQPRSTISCDIDGFASAQLRISNEVNVFKRKSKHNCDLFFTENEKFVLFTVMAEMVAEVKRWHPELDLHKSMQAVIAAHTVAHTGGLYERTADRFRAKIQS